VIYRGNTTTAFDLQQAYGIGSYFSAVTFNKWSSGFGGDFFNLTYFYYSALPGTGLLQITLSLTFRYNYTSRAYGLNLSSNFNTVASFQHYIIAMLMGEIC
jgi:hypothetical protein